MPHISNLVLASLPASELERLLPHLRVLHTHQDQVVAETDQKIETVYFPHSGILSYIVQMKDGGTIEIGMVGRDGVMGAGAALDDRVSLSKVVVQVPGAASAIDAGRIHELARSNEVLRSVLARHELLLYAETQQTAACNASHGLEGRMCRWLLRMHDLSGAYFPLTQELFAHMLGVRRTSVSIIASSLQSAGIIKYSRGHVKILDVAELSKLACECYAAVKEHQRSLACIDAKVPYPDGHAVT